MARAILLIGPVGSGKTTTLHELEAILAARGEPHAILDLDWLAWAAPAPVTGLTAHDLLIRNLADVWRNFQAAGIRRIARARALHDDGEVQAVRAALSGCETLVVDLVGDVALLRERVQRRDAGVELAEHLAMLDAYERGERYLRADAVVEIDDRTPVQVARDVLAVAGW